jgi:hypothetical protein
MKEEFRVGLEAVNDLRVAVHKATERPGMRWPTAARKVLGGLGKALKHHLDFI